MWFFDKQILSTFTVVKHKKKLTYYFLLLFLKLTFSQNKQLDFIFENPNLQNYTMKKGLPSNFCNRIIQDKKGFIWIATQNGLSRFDTVKRGLVENGYYNTYHTMAVDYSEERLDLDAVDNVSPAA